MMNIDAGFFRTIMANSRIEVIDRPDRIQMFESDRLVVCSIPGDTRFPVRYFICQRSTDVDIVPERFVLWFLAANFRLAGARVAIGLCDPNTYREIAYRQAVAAYIAGLTQKAIAKAGTREKATTVIPGTRIRILEGPYQTETERQKTKVSDREYWRMQNRKNGPRQWQAQPKGQRTRYR